MNVRDRLAVTWVAVAAPEWCCARPEDVGAKVNHNSGASLLVTSCSLTRPGKTYPECICVPGEGNTNQGLGAVAEPG